MTGAPKVARLGPLAAVGVLALLLAAIGFGLVAPVLAARQEARMAIAETQALIERFNGVAAARDTVEAQVAAARQSLAESPVFLRGETQTVASAELQRRLRALVDESGGQVQILRDLPAGTPRDGLVPLRVQVSFTAPIQGVSSVLAAIETGQPLLFVDGVSVRATLARTDPTRPFTTAPDLQAQITVRGFGLEATP